MKKRTLGVLTSIIFGLFVSACDHNEFTASERNSSLNRRPLYQTTTNQYEQFPMNISNDVHYPNNMEYHQKVVIDEHNKAVPASNFEELFAGSKR